MDGMIFILGGIAVFIGGVFLLYQTRGSERIERPKQERTRFQRLSRIVFEIVAAIGILIVAYYALVILAVTSCLTSTC
jgi:cytochrome c biogenesis factor